MKLTQKHFKIFKDECLKWQKKLGLTNFKFYFQFIYMKGVLAEANCHEISDYHCTITLSNDWGDHAEEVMDNDIRRVACHEVLHVLLVRFQVCANSRFVGEDEIDEAEHEVVRRLENLFYN